MGWHYGESRAAAEHGKVNGAGSSAEGYRHLVPRHDSDDSRGKDMFRDGEPCGEGFTAEAGEAIPVGAHPAGLGGGLPGIP